MKSRENRPALIE